MMKEFNKYYIDKLIDTSSRVLAEIYNIPEQEIRTVGKRTKEIMEARRMFMFYLNRHLEIKHAHMKKYIKGINHATSIHHCNKMEFLISMKEKESYKIYDKQYSEFKKRMKEHDTLNRVMIEKKEQMIQLQAELNTYFKEHVERI